VHGATNDVDEDLTEWLRYMGLLTDVPTRTEGNFVGTRELSDAQILIHQKLQEATMDPEGFDIKDVIEA
jgi:hypothetical protein